MKNRRENPQQFTPVVGEIYENAGGGRYICLAVLSDREAKVQNTASGWTCLAHGIVRYEDGTIEWDYSKWGSFQTGRLSEIRQLQRSMVNAMLCCLI